MNLLFLNRSFYPDVEATGQFLTELCEDLTKEGHGVTVVAGKSYHVTGSKRHNLIQREFYKSVEIVRAYGTNFPKRFLLFRLINLGTYFLLAFVGSFFIKNKPDIVVAQTDPPLLGLLGIFFSKWYKAKFIYSCKDIYPEVGIITGRLTNPIFNFLLEKINMLSFKESDKVICLGEDMKKRVMDKGIEGNKIIIIHDWADTNELYPVAESENLFRKKYKFNGYFTIMYSGNIGLTQGLENVIQVASYFKNAKEIKFLFVGEGAYKLNLMKIVTKENLSNVEFLPYQPKEELQYSLSAPNIHLISFQKGLKGVIVPSKVYGILSCGRPFIAWVDKGSEIDIIARKFKCGITTTPGNIKNMIRGITWAIKHPEILVSMGANARKAAVKFFDRKISVAKFIETMEEVGSI